MVLYYVTYNEFDKDIVLEEGILNGRTHQKHIMSSVWEYFCMKCKKVMRFLSNSQCSNSTVWTATSNFVIEL